MHGAVDPELGLFYVTFGNVRSCGSSQDGQTRPGDNLFGNSIVALDMQDRCLQVALPVGPPRHLRHGQRPLAGAGRRDRSAGRRRKALYYGSKAHMTFMLDRTNGKPLTGPIDFKPRPVDSRQNNAPTQPFPAHGTWVDTLGPAPTVHRLGEARHQQHPGQPVARRAELQRLPADANGNLVYTEPNYLDVDKPFVQYPAVTTRAVRRAGAPSGLPVRAALRLAGAVDDQPERRRRPGRTTATARARTCTTSRTASTPVAHYRFGRQQRPACAR